MSENDENPYEAPGAQLTERQTSARGGSIEATLDGRAELDFGEVISEAWRLTKGIKRIIVGGLILIGVVFAVLIGGMFGTGALNPESTGASLILQLIITALVAPFAAGLVLVCIRQSVGHPVEFSQLFMYYSSGLTIVVLNILISIMTSIGYLLLILPGLYLAIATILAIPLHVEKGLGIVESVTTSIKLINKKFLQVFLLFIAMFVGGMLGIITIIGWIWLVPWSMMVIAIIYRQLAGVEEDT